METFDEIRQILKEVAITQQKTSATLDRISADFDRRDADFDRRSAEFDRRSADFERIGVDLDRIKETQAETARQLEENAREAKETDRRFKETDRQFKETDRKLKELGRQIGGIGERFGSFTEGLAYPSLRKVLRKQYGIDNTVANYLKRFPDGSEIELDAFGFTNGTLNNAVVVEVKTHLQSKHIYEFRELLKNFKPNFPEFASKHLYGILVTARIVSKELRKEIFDNGLHLAIVHDNVFGLERNPNAIDFNYDTTLID